MANDISFDDLTPTKQTSTPSKGVDLSFDDLVSKPTPAPAATSASAPVEGSGGAAFGVYPKPGMQPSKEGDATALGVLATRYPEAAAAARGGLAVGRLAAAVTPPVLPVVGPFAKPIATVAGGLVGAYATSMGINSLEEEVDKLFGTDIIGLKRRQEEQRPGLVFATEMAGGAVNPWMRPGLPKNIAEGAIGAGIQLGIGGASRAAAGQDILDPKSTAADILTGAFTKPTQRGYRALGMESPTATTKKTTVGDFPEKPPEGATAEEKATYVEKLKTIKAERDSKAPLVEAAIRNKSTGEIERMGPKHDQARKDATKDTHEEGFVDERGNFHERQIAVNQAKRAGQIPADHVLENPPGERPGLHSGDLRKVGDKRFAITEDQPAGVAKDTTEETPTTRDDYKKAITNKEDLVYLDLEARKQEALNKGDTETATKLDAEQNKALKELIDLRKSMPSVEFKNALKPTWEELHDHLWGSSSIGEAFDRILATDGLGSKGQRTLMKALNQSEYIRDTGLTLSNEYVPYTDKYGKEQKAAGLYTGGAEHRIDMGATGNLRVLIHEAMHSGTQRLLSEGNTPAALRLQELHKEFLNKYETGYEAALEKFKQEKVQPTMGELREFDKQYKKHYGLEDVHEFVSEAFTNKEFQKLLSGVKTTTPEGKLSNLWNDFKNTVREGLNIPEKERTALDEVFEQGATLIEESKGFKSTDTISTIVSPSRLSQQIHDDLGREGIAVAHSSPHKFKMFDWIKHALKGEGNMAFGAGSYHSTSDTTDRGYQWMSKERVKEKYLQDNPEAALEKDYLSSKINLLTSQRSKLQEKANSYFEKIDRTGANGKDAIDSYKEANKLFSEANKYDAQIKQYREALKEFEDRLSADTKVPTYHSTIKAKPEELLDWNAAKQSTLVKEAFKKLGIDTTGFKLTLVEGNNYVDQTGKDWEIKPIQDNEGAWIWTASHKEDGFPLAEGNTKEEVLQKLLENIKPGMQLYKELSRKLMPTDKEVANILKQAKKEGHPLADKQPWMLKMYLGEFKASIALAEQGVVGNVHDSQFGQNKVNRNYVVFDDTKVQQNLVTLASKAEPTTSSKDELVTKTSEPVAKEFQKLDPRSMPSEEAMLNHATDIYERYGEADAIKFFDDYKKNLNERSIPVPNNNEQLDDMLHKMNTFVTKDRSENVVGYKENTAAGVTDEQRAKWFDMRERGEELPPEAKAVLDPIDAENIALVRKAKGMGLDVGEEFTSGQSRIRLFSEKEKPGWKDTIKKFFSNDTPMGDKIAEQADASIERKVFQTDDGRVIELHRQPEDTKIKMPNGEYREIKKGTEIWEWKDGRKQLIGFSDNLQLKRGDKFETKKFSDKLSEGPDVGTASERRTLKPELTIVDGRVPEIERNSPYRYLHDAEASARIANMGLRKMVREAEAVENLKKSEMFKRVGHSPDQPLKDLPKGWVVPNNIDRIPQLRGWHFDPKTAAIISDFAKVWNDGMYMKLSNAIVKNMMLNPIPHMFNEVMHLWNARGFTGWVDPRQLGSFADTARVAWRDVGNQTQFYRDIMREGGSILGADPRNKGYFDTIIKDASKEMFGTPEMERNMVGLAKKLGTPVGNLYNGISEASQKAMWFTRDVMYVQLIREIMARQEKSGNKLTLKEAIDHAERHMPNYRLPSEVVGSRMVSQVLRDPRVSMFSRYHYGMVKSLVNTLKDVDPRNLKTPEGRQHFREGVDSMIAIGIAMNVLYPLMDKMAEAVFGEGAEQRRAGPFHLIQAGLDVYSGKKDASALVWPVFTFNPVLLTLGQLGLNKKVFTGKSIYHPDDDFATIMGDVGAYTAGQIPQVPPIMSATAEEGGQSKLLARQLDIKVKTDAEKQREERAKKYQQTSKKTRDKQREKETYRR